MAKVPVYFSEAGVPRTGLTPTWKTLFTVEDGSPVSSAATTAPVVEIGGGWYAFEWDVLTRGAAVGVLDAGASISAASDRYVAVSVIDTQAEQLDAIYKATFGKKVKRGGAVPTSLEILDPSDLTTRVAKWNISQAGTAAETWTPE